MWTMDLLKEGNKVEILNKNNSAISSLFSETWEAKHKTSALIPAPARVKNNCLVINKTYIY